MKRTSHRSAAALALAACSTFSLAACGSTSTSSAQSGKTITFIAAQYTDTTKAFWDSLIAKFEQKYPGEHVKLDVVSFADLNQKVATLVANNQEPDLLNFTGFSDFAKDGLLYPATDIVSPSLYKDLAAPFPGNSSYNGTAYAIPAGESDRPLFYNKDIFAKAGISSPPTTWSALEADALKIKAAGYIGYGLPLGSEEAQGEFSMWMWNNGGDWKGSDGKWTINSPQNLQALQFLNRLANVDKVTENNPGYANRTDDVWQMFAQGKIGMAMGSSVTFTGMLAANPSVHYGIAPPPSNDGSAPQTLGVADYLMAFKKPGDAQVSTVRDFLDFFYQDQNYVGFLSPLGGLPATTSGLQAMASNAALKPFLDVLPQARFYPATDPAWPAVQSAVQHELGLALQSSSPESVLNRLQQEAEQAAARSR